MLRDLVARTCLNRVPCVTIDSLILDDPYHTKDLLGYPGCRSKTPTAVARRDLGILTMRTCEAKGASGQVKKKEEEDDDREDDKWGLNWGEQ